MANDCCGTTIHTRVFMILVQRLVWCNIPWPPLSINSMVLISTTQQNQTFFRVQTSAFDQVKTQKQIQVIIEQYQRIFYHLLHYKFRLGCSSNIKTRRCLSMYSYWGAWVLFSFWMVRWSVEPHQSSLQPYNKQILIIYILYLYFNYTTNRYKASVLKI